MNELRECASQWLAERTPSIRISVVQTRGSTPQGCGASMLVGESRIVGTIGGGNLEWQAIARARRMLTETSTVDVSEQQTLGPSLGQCCGGALTLRYQSVDTSLLSNWADEDQLFELHLFGMGHVGEALVQVLSAVHCVIHWHDEREDIVELRRSQWQHRISRAQLLWHDDCNDLPDQTGFHRTRFALIMTHSHALDFEITRSLLSRSGFGFVGLIGSKSKRARFLSKLAQSGLDTNSIARLTCPIGLDGIKFKQPGLLAISIAAQLLQLAQAGQQARGTDAGKVGESVHQRPDRPPTTTTDAALSCSPLI